MRLLVSGFLLISMVMADAVCAKDEKPNFEFGLGGGLLNSEPLFNIDVLVNIPLTETYSTQVFLNSNYLMTGHSRDSFAQSELSSNWFARNDWGRLGVGAGFSEVKPKDTTKETDRVVIGRFMADGYMNSVTLTGNYTSYNRKNLSNINSTMVGMSYYLSDDQRISLYRERYNSDFGWRLEAFYQPEKYHQLGTIGLIARTGDSNDYLGIVARYYFDTAVSLKYRERHYH